MINSMDTETVSFGPPGWVRDPLAVHKSSKKDTWETPQWILDRLGPIALDPCTNFSNPTGANRICVSPEEWEAGLDCELLESAFCDGLNWDWNEMVGYGFGSGLIYVNPPYGRGIIKWLERGLDCENIAYLLPARTDTKWFHEYNKHFDVGLFLKGRLVFKGAVGKNGKPQPAPFPSMLLYRGDRDWFTKAFEGCGTFVGD